MILHEIEQRMATLSRAERQVAQQVLADPEGCPNLTIGELAGAAGVSEPTVVRFCRSMDCDGYLAFKLRVAQDIATTTPVRREVKPGDPSSAIVHSVVRSVQSRLHDLLFECDASQLDLAMALLEDASRIEIYGMGGSGNVAREAQLRFLRLGKPVVCHTDPHIHAAAAALLTAQTVVLAISHSGRNRDLITSVEIAKSRGARVVAITAPRSPLAALASAVCEIEPSDGKELLMPLSSRVAQLVLVDTLAVAMAMRDNTQRQQLGRANAALDDKYLSEDDGDTPPI